MKIVIMRFSIKPLHQNFTDNKSDSVICMRFNCMPVQSFGISKGIITHTLSDWKCIIRTQL